MNDVRGLFDLSGKAALVTGGNSGLGLGFARGLAKQGADVMLWGRSPEKNTAAVASLSAYGGRVEARSVDVVSEDAVKAGMAEAVDVFGRLDCVIANAGISNGSPSFVELESSIYHELLATNQHGAFYTLREAARHMVARAEAGDPGGSLIICGSLTVFRGTPGRIHYGAAKGAMASMMVGMAADLGKYGIRANMIAPGYIKTDLGRSRPQGEISATDQIFTERAPLRRVGRPEDFEAIAAYLASDASSFHSGDIIVIDGGWMANIY